MPTVVVTGASRGLGLEFVSQYARDGWSVFAGARRIAEDGPLCELGRLKAGGAVTALPLDVTDPASVDAFAAKLSGRPVDLLINNAGIVGPAAQGLMDVDPSGWRDAVATNVIGPVLLSRALLPALRAGDLRRIVVITSRVGSIAGAGGGRYVYRTTKAAANMVVSNLAADLADEHIDVVAIHPGWVRTDMGGDRAPISPARSVAGIRRVIDAPEPRISGRFLDFEGKDLDW